MTILYSFLFLTPPSLFVTVMSVVSFTSSSNLGLSELRGKHVEYSKFWAANNPGNKKQLPSKIGMLVSYTPALVAALASLAFLGDAGPRRFLLSSALSIHFFKRVFEVLFIHRYSGHMSLETTIMISSSYLITTVTMIYAQHLTRDMAEPVLNLKYTGVVLFLVGITGNFYHHYLLSKLRKKDDRGYKIPRGGLFELVVCPHYLFEIVGFMGVAFISQTIYAFSFTLGSMFYLIGRSYSTRKWRNLLNVLEFLRKPNASELVSGTKDRVNLYEKFRNAIESAFPGKIDRLTLEAQEKMAPQRKPTFWESVTDANVGGFKFSF